MGKKHRDWFPYYLAGALIVLAAAIGVSIRSHHYGWALFVIILFVLIALAFGGWVASRFYIRGLVIHLLQLHGGQMSIEELKAHFPQLDMVEAVTDQLVRKKIVSLEARQIRLVRTKFGKGLTTWMVKRARRHTYR